MSPHKGVRGFVRRGKQRASRGRGRGRAGGRASPGDGAGMINKRRRERELPEEVMRGDEEDLDRWEEEEVEEKKGRQ